MRSRRDGMFDIDLSIGGEFIQTYQRAFPRRPSDESFEKASGDISSYFKNVGMERETMNV